MNDLAWERNVGRAELGAWMAYVVLLCHACAWIATSWLARICMLMSDAGPGLESGYHMNDSLVVANACQFEKKDTRASKDASECVHMHVHKTKLVREKK
jgi:hypothetical protein